MSNERAPFLFLICIFFLLICGLASITWGKRLPGKGSWLILPGLLVLFAGIGLNAGFFQQEAFQIKTWMSGWIWSKNDIGAITVGIYQDALSLAMTALATIISSLMLLNHELLSREPSPERSRSALAISTAGVALAWNSLTPWLVFVGVMLTALGGFISLGARWDSNSEADLASRFISERAAGIVIGFLGACILATSRSALLLNSPEVLTTQGDNYFSTWLGSILLIIGLFIQIQPFPFLSWIVSSSDLYPPLRVLLNHIFPAWAAFSVFIRLEPQLIHLGLFPGFGWVALISTLLLVLSGLFQKRWQLSVGVWLAAGYSLSFAFLAWSGPVAALGLMIGVSIGALVISGVANALESGGSSSTQKNQGALWLKTACFLGVASGTGLIGFISATGGLKWVSQLIESPSTSAPGLIVLFMFVLLGWKIFWHVIRLKKGAEASWVFILSTYILIVISMSILWTGTVSGNAISGDVDRLMGSLFTEFFGSRAASVAESNEIIAVSSLYWGTFILAFILAYWTSGRSEDHWSRLAALFPRGSQFISKGYGVDHLTQKLTAGISWFGKSAESFIDYKVWAMWIPKGMLSVIRAASEISNGLDLSISRYLGIGLSKFVNTPAIFLQLIQTGDLRWYLFFAISSGFALLLHFLRT